MECFCAPFMWYGGVDHRWCNDGGVSQHPFSVEGLLSPHLPGHWANYSVSDFHSMTVVTNLET